MLAQLTSVRARDATPRPLPTLSTLAQLTDTALLCLHPADPERWGSHYVNHQLRPVLTLPVVRPDEIRGPTVVCVSLRRADESGAPGETGRRPRRWGSSRARRSGTFFDGDLVRAWPSAETQPLRSHWLL